MENNTTANNKRIAKNTLFLYFRTLLTMLVSLYTARVVLSTLGVEDYGIYNIVGGVILMFGFLNSSMSAATSRFLTFELGSGNFEKLKKTFSAALTIHFIIAGIILVLGETIGLWWLESKMIIPSEKMNIARWVYQLSILSSMISITQVPYNATIIAHEKMGVYAYVEILNSFLKLGIVYLLVIFDFDKLILYAVLVLCVTIIITTIYKVYCTKNYHESHYKFEWNRKIIKPMLNFSGWDLFLNLSFTFKTQGVNMILNLFFGVIINAAYGIAAQVQRLVNTFASNISTAVRPQIVKYYAAGEIKKMQDLVISASKIIFLLIFLLIFPLIIENNFILNIWLKEIPDYAVIFCQLFLVASLMSMTNTPVKIAIQATGKIKKVSIINGIVFLLVLPISYFLFTVGFPPTVPMVTNIALYVIALIINLVALKKLVPKFSLKAFVLKYCFIAITIAIITSILPLFIHFSMKEGLIRFLLVSGSFVVILFIMSYFIALSNDMKQKLRQLIYNKLKLKKWKG